MCNVYKEFYVGSARRLLISGKLGEFLKLKSFTVYRIFSDSVQILEVKKIRKVLDQDFVEKVEKIAEKFFLNYTGKNVQGYFSLPSGKRCPANSPVIRTPPVYLSAELNFGEYKGREVIGSLVLHEGGLYSGSEVFHGKSDEYKITFLPDFSYTVSFPQQHHSILPSRIIDYHRGVFSALENATKNTIVQPTRFLPSHEDTLIKLKRWDISNKVEERLMNAGYQYFYSDLRREIVIGDRRYKLSEEKGIPTILVNPLKGRIAGESDMTGFVLDGSIASAVLQKLYEEMSNLEREVNVALLEFTPTNLTDVGEKIRIEKMVAR